MEEKFRFLVFKLNSQQEFITIYLNLGLAHHYHNPKWKILRKYGRF